MPRAKGGGAPVSSNDLGGLLERERLPSGLGDLAEPLIAEGRELPESIALMAAGAVSGLIFDELLTGRAERLPELLPELLFALLVPYIGPSAATEEMSKVAAAA